MLYNLRQFHVVQSVAVSCCTIGGSFKLYNLRQFQAIQSEAVSCCTI